LGAVFWIAITWLLTETDYGLANYLLSIGRIAAVFSTLGLDVTVMTFYPKERDAELLRQACLMTLLLSVTASILCVMLRLPLVAPFIISLVAFSMTAAVQLGRRMYQRYFHLCLSLGVLRLVLGILLCFFYGVAGVIVGYTLASILVGYEYMRLIRPTLRLGKVGEKINFSLHGLGMRATTALMNFADKIIIPHAFGMEILSLYTIAYQFFMMFSMLSIGLFQYLLPEKSSGARGRRVELLGMALATGAMFLGIAVSPYVIENFFPGWTAGSIIAIQISIVGTIPAAIANIRSAKYFSEERPVRVSVAYLASFVFQIVSILALGSVFGLTGLAVALVLTRAVMVVLIR
ncbi:TPA: hypothetical protein EYP44_05350, partial [Candidatus Bathyarchaeota archaeon]|nr:hypothetical protein [Candidatus Bathyarchaeota archaeon]